MKNLNIFCDYIYANLQIESFDLYFCLSIANLVEYKLSGGSGKSRSVNGVHSHLRFIERCLF